MLRIKSVKSYNVKVGEYYNNHSIALFIYTVMNLKRTGNNQITSVATRTSVFVLVMRADALVLIRADALGITLSLPAFTNLSPLMKT